MPTPRSLTLRLSIIAILSALALTLALPFAYADTGELVTTKTPGHQENFAQSPRPRGRADRGDAVGEQVFSVHATRTLTLNPATLYKIDPTLRKRLLTAAPGEHIPIIIELREQADLDAALAGLAQTDRGATLVGALQTTAARSQRSIRSALAQIAQSGRASDVRPFWIFNGLAARVAAEDIATLAARDDVALIREDRYRQWLTDYPTTQPANSPTTRLSDSPTNPEWGIHHIRADEVWAALGITGTGVVVANMDTGVEWIHPALQAAYRGYNKGLSYHAGNWFDATNGDATYPIDPHGHGTHTMGTIVGADGIGVAPGARWIAARVLNAAGFGYDSWIHAGFEWVLAPDGNPALAPDVLNNSWGSSLSANTVFQNDLRALRSAGIFAVFSSGNDGPGAGSVGSPASLPEAFAVGAIDNEDDVASFSSRGPSPWGEVRPHLVAPGVSVRSSIPGGTFAESNGTSMAAPHVAGAVALMLSADPALTITDTAFVLTGTAVPLSATIPNNDSGYGRLDAFAAVQAVANAGAISGTVTRSDTGAPIPGATVTAVASGGATSSATTDANGRYTRSLVASTYTVTAFAFGYLTATQAPVFVLTGTATPLNFSLARLPSGVVRGSFTDAGSGQPISGTLVVAGTPVTTAANNAYSLTLPAGTFELRAIAWGHRVLTASVTINAGQIVTRNFALPPAPTILLVDSGAWYNDSQITAYRAALDDAGFTYAERRVKNLSADVPLSATLAPYDIVAWSAPLDSPGLIGAGDAISDYLSSGGLLFLSGQDVGFYDGGLASTWASYYYDRLKALALADDSESRTLTGAGVFEGIAVSIAGPGGADNQAYPDAIGSAQPDFTADAFRYDNDRLGGMVTGLCLPYRAVYFGFGFEAIEGAATRRDVMSRALDALTAPRNAAGIALAAPDDVLITQAGSAVPEPIRLRNVGELGGSDQFTLTAQSSGWGVSLTQSTVTLGSCVAATITATVSIPPGTPANVSHAVTVTARSTVSPSLVVSETFVVKSPAIALLVDDDRFYDVETVYQTALISNGISFDRWNVPKAWAGDEPATPPRDRLDWYPFVIWFTGYDWYQPLTANNEATLTHYLDAGGRVLISSQSHLGWSGISDFSHTRLGALDAGYVTTTLARSVPGGPFDGLGTLALSYTFPNWSESAAPYPTATVGFVGSHGRPIALARADGAGKALFFSFPFEAIQPADRPAVMERAMGYLSWLGGSTASADRAVAAPGSNVSVTVAIRNDGATTLPAASFSASLPSGVSVQSGSAAWSGPLAPGQAVTTTFVAALDSGLAPGSVVTISVAFTDDAHGITFRRLVRIGIQRPDLSASAIAVAANPARSQQIVTWTVVARNTGPVAAPLATITGLLPIDLPIVSGTLRASTGSAAEVSGTVQWTGAILSGGRITLTYQMVVTRTLNDRLYFGSALFDDGVTLHHAPAWLATTPHRYYLPRVSK